MEFYIFAEAGLCGCVIEACGTFRQDEILAVLSNCAALEVLHFECCDVMSDFLALEAENFRFTCNCPYPSVMLTRKDAQVRRLFRKFKSFPFQSCYDVCND